MEATRISHPRTSFAALIAAVLLVAGTGTSAAQTATPPDPIPVDAVCANLHEGFAPFEDIEGDTFELHIRCLASAEITEGTGAGSATDPRDAFEPDTPVTRQQMASFIARLIDTAHALAPDTVTALPAFDGVYQFQDVHPEYVHFENINRLGAAGLVLGGPGSLDQDQFGPLLTVNRGQMASFIDRAYEYMVGTPLEADETYFTDVAGNVHAPAIDAVAANAIAVGFGDGTFGPDEAVTRGQMSGFLVRTLATMQAGGEIPVLAAPADTTTAEVWFLQGQVLEAEHRTVPAPSPATVAMDRLATGPTTPGLVSEIPDGTEVLGVTISDGVATVDLSATFEAGGGSLSARARVAQVVFTMTQFDTVDGVLFAIDGDLQTTITSEGIVVTDPLDRSGFSDLLG
ncbi:MAG: GerMN domain-containing protein [Acidimicrobiales bacterium]